MAREEELLDDMIREIAEFVFSSNPALATRLGAHEFDSLMADTGAAAQQLKARRARRLLDELSSVDESKLSFSKLVDKKTLESMLREEIVLQEWGYWRLAPTGPVVVWESLSSLLQQNLPEEHLESSLSSRLARSYAALDDSLKAATTPYSLNVRASRVYAYSLKRLAYHVASLAEKRGWEDVAREATRLAEYVDRYVGQLEDAEKNSAEGFKPMGRQLFLELLKARLVDAQPEELWELFHAEKEKYKRLVSELSPGETRGIQVREALSVARSVAARLVELPDGERLELVEMPSYMGTLFPAAAYVAPQPLGWRKTGKLYVSKSLEGYKALNVVAHEAYPGHHVHFSYAYSGSRLARLVHCPPETVEGWGHYSEELVIEAGVSEPGYKLVAYSAALRRAARAIVDVELAMGTMSFWEAVSYLAREAGISRDEAEAEVLRSLLRPGYQLSYTYGKSMILDLRSYASRKLGPRYSHKLFHKLVLEEGCAPLNLVVKAVKKKLGGS